MSARQFIFTIVGIAVYFGASSSLLHLLTSQFYRSSVQRLGVRRAATLRFSIRVCGYIVILLGLLAILHIPVSKILVGSALIGVILSVAAQQSLANFFASVVIIIDHPFSVGQGITLVSGGLGGMYKGTVTDINFSHTTLEMEDGSHVKLPNAPLLSATAIIEPPKQTTKKTPKKHKSSTQVSNKKSKQTIIQE
jgi:small-conductance mechanosensitive channel